MALVSCEFKDPDSFSSNSALSRLDTKLVLGYKLKSGGSSS